MPPLRAHYVSISFSVAVAMLIGSLVGVQIRALTTKVIAGVSIALVFAGLGINTDGNGNREEG